MPPNRDSLPKHRHTSHHKLHSNVTECETTLLTRVGLCMAPPSTGRRFFKREVVHFRRAMRTHILDLVLVAFGGVYGACVLRSLRLVVCSHRLFPQTGCMFPQTFVVSMCPQTDIMFP